MKINLVKNEVVITKKENAAMSNPKSDEFAEYSCAAKPPVRKRGNRLSGRMETIVIPVRRSRLSGVA